MKRECLASRGGEGMGDASFLQIDFAIQYGECKRLGACLLLNHYYSLIMTSTHDKLGDNMQMGVMIR